LNLVFLSNNLMIMGLHALKEQGLVSTENTVVFHGNKVNPALFSDFTSHKVAIAHGCSGRVKLFCIRKFIQDVKRKIDETIGDQSFDLITPHLHHLIYEIAYLDPRCTSVSYLEEGSLSYTGLYLPKPEIHDPLAPMLYGHKRLKDKIYFTPNYKVAYALSSESFTWAKGKRVEVKLPQNIPGYKFKTSESTVIAAVPKLYVWGDYREQAKVWNEKLRAKCEELGLKVVVKPHPGHYNEVRLGILKEDFHWADSINTDNELIVELEVPTQKSHLVTYQNSLADVLPLYGCDITVIDF